MGISLLDNSLHVEVYFETTDADLEDNICLCITESCPEDERLFRAKKTHIFLTVREAGTLAQALVDAIDSSKEG
ncbi:MAG TPA: hypothetical protein PLI60_00570 [Anaerolineaceae bacterium]|nr:hypothetical protein [Anaerolineaceae bacterium]HQN04481.1 hypothetical protein [Anaerolineaceae bacterium]HQP07629.1 hypothetical protein [Anaerolineaceae bacterium]